jgi:hypothetical protein
MLIYDLLRAQGVQLKDVRRLLVFHKRKVVELSEEEKQLTFAIRETKEYLVREGNGRNVK